MANEIGNEALTWGEEEFGRAKLGNTLRTKRVIKMAAEVAERPAGKITEAFASSASRIGAYKFLESSHSEPAELARAAHLACAARCRESLAPFAYVPVDGTSLNIVDRGQAKGTGPLGNRSTQARGLQVMNAIAVLADGTPAGVCGQTYWARKEKPAPKGNRPFDQKETRHWLNTIEQVHDVFSEAGGACVPWYQLDRGGDFREMLLWAVASSCHVTHRARHDRAIMGHDQVDGNNGIHRLRAHLESQEDVAFYEMKVATRPKRKGRCANMAIRYAQVELPIRDEDGNNHVVKLHAVLTQEKNTTPLGNKPIEWLLLTTFSVQSFDDAKHVVEGYAQRWRIEEFHKSWKSCCNVEQMQLRDFSPMVTWAIILASVALRIERLKYLARNRPDTPSDVELTQSEIDAVILLSRTKKYKTGDTPPIAFVVDVIARKGGYIGKSSGGPPGTIVLARGLERIRGAVDVLEIIREN